MYVCIYVWLGAGCDVGEREGGSGGATAAQSRGRMNKKYRPARTAATFRAIAMRLLPGTKKK